MSNFFLRIDPVVTLNDKNDLARAAYQNTKHEIPLRNNNTSMDRIESDNFINHRELFDTNNSRINSLNDEIRELKDELKIIDEKNSKIISLENDLSDLKMRVNDYDIIKRKMSSHEQTIGTLNRKS